MPKRSPIGYIVKIDGNEVTLNLLDLHKGSVAGHDEGVSDVTQIGSLLAIDSGLQILVMQVKTISFTEPKEAHRLGVGSMNISSEPLREISGFIIGRIEMSEAGNEKDEEISYTQDSLISPPLGAKVYPLTNNEKLKIYCGSNIDEANLNIGKQQNGGREISITVEDLVSRHVAVLGSTGQGKSCFTAAILQQIINLAYARVIIFDLNGEYLKAFPEEQHGESVKITTIGGSGKNYYKIPYYALGRTGLQRLLLPSDKSQRPALNFALDCLNRVKCFDGQSGVGLLNDAAPNMFDDCRTDNPELAYKSIQALRTNKAKIAENWPPMYALGALIAESYVLARKGSSYERKNFNYGHVSPLINRIYRYIDDEMFSEVIDVNGSNGQKSKINWQSESAQLIKKIFGSENRTEDTWKLHIVDLQKVPNDLSPYILGSLLELYLSELFRRGQDAKIPTLLVLEEAHNYIRNPARFEDGDQSSLAYERLAKEGRKFGLALWLSTQRPSELSSTVLSQCNNWFCFRLTSERDLDTIRYASETLDRRELRKISGLPRRNLLAFGGGLNLPVVLQTPEASPTPKSEDANFNSWK